MKMMTQARAQIAQNQIVVTDADVERLERALKGVGAVGSSQFRYVQSLKGELGRAAVVPAREVPADVVTMNTRVKVRDVKTRKTETYRLVYPQDAGSSDDALSVLAPIGTALLGARVGDVVTWAVPAGERTLRVEEILYQPEAEGRYDL